MGASPSKGQSPTVLSSRLSRASGDGSRAPAFGHSQRDSEQYIQTGRLEMSMKYAVVIEKSETGFGAYVPDLPGCVAVGETLAETERLIREAVEFHLEGLREDGIPVPEPSTVTQYVEI
jgi:predicted RNase H-like HicB family nuclease